jgi:hypothetical protein
MFRSCEILLSQNLTRDPKTEKRLYVKLLDPKPPVITSDTNIYDYMSKVASKGKRFTFWGKWRVGVNNVTGGRDNAYSIGDPDHENPRVWIMSAERQSLDFIQTKKRKLGDGLTFGDEKADVALSLLNIRLTNKGIEPALGRGLGIAYIGSALFARNQSLNWQPDFSGVEY